MTHRSGYDLARSICHELGIAWTDPRSGITYASPTEAHSMRGQLRIDEMFAFIVLDSDGTEGVPAVGLGTMMFPLMGADMDRIDSLREIVRADPALRGKRITLAKFSVRENIEVIDRSGENVG